MPIELKQRKQELLISREQLRHVLEQTLDAIVIVDREGIVHFANPNAESLLGCETGQNLSELFDFPVASDENAEIEIIRKNREKITAEMRVTDIEWEGESAYLVSLRDVTKRLQAGAETKCCDIERERSNRELQKFAYVASHAFQVPLHMVTSHVQLLAQRYKGRLDADADDLIAYALDGANHIQNLLDDLLAYSRVSAHFRVHESTDCTEAVDWALANLRPVIEESGAIVSYSGLPVVVADRVQLAQLFQNLISNAIKFRSEEPPRIYILAERKNDEWIFSIRDNGIGVDPDYADRIFAIFQRLHSREEYPGTGMGLAMCKKIADRHGGRIWVESQPDEGATFYFTIPL